MHEPGPSDNDVAPSVPSDAWQQFASFYQSFLFQAWQEAILAPARAQEAAAEAVKLWQLPSRAEQDEVLSLLQELSARVDRLAGRIGQMEQQLREQQDG